MSACLLCLEAEKLHGFDHTFSLSSVSRTCIKIYRAGGKAWGPVFPVPCLMPPWALPVWVSGPGLPAGNLSNSVPKRGREREGVAESHTQTLHPKEEQHASPSGHLFSQVCSPNVIKIGATHPPSNVALVRQHRGCWGMGVRREEQLCCFGADGNDDESLSGKGRSKWRRKREVRRRRVMRESSWGLFATNNCLEKHKLRRMGLFWAHADYPLLFDS